MCKSANLWHIPNIAPSTPRDPDAMDVDHKFTRLSPQEKARHIAKRLCFICSKPGHQTRNSPNRNSQPRWGTGYSRPPYDSRRPTDQRYQGRGPIQSGNYNRAARQGYAAYQQIKGVMEEGSSIWENEEGDDVAGMDAEGTDIRAEETRPYGPEAEVRQIHGCLSSNRDSNGAYDTSPPWAPPRHARTNSIRGTRTPEGSVVSRDTESSMDRTVVEVNRLMQEIMNDDGVNEALRSINGKDFLKTQLHRRKSESHHMYQIWIRIYQWDIGLKF